MPAGLQATLSAEEAVATTTALHVLRALVQPASCEELAQRHELTLEEAGQVLARLHQLRLIETVGGKLYAQTHGVRQAGLTRLLRVLGCGIDVVYPVLQPGPVHLFAAGGQSGGSKHFAAGAGSDPLAALSGCLGEAVERVALASSQEQTAHRCALADLPGKGLDVGLGDARDIDWVTAQAVHGEGVLYIPVQWCFLDHGGDAAAGAPAPASSIGCAAGQTWQDAVKAGLAELLERDAVLRWWNHLRPGTAMQPPPHDDAVAVAKTFAAWGRELWWIDLGLSGHVHVVVAVSAKLDGTAPSLGFGGGETSAQAGAKAALELLQVECSAQLIERATQNAAGQSIPQRSRNLIDWRNNVNAVTDTLLGPAHLGAAQISTGVDHGPYPGENLLTNHDIDVFAIDLTQRMIDVPAARVIAVRRASSGRARIKLKDLIGYGLGAATNRSENFSIPPV